MKKKTCRFIALMSAMAMAFTGCGASVNTDTEKSESSVEKSSEKSEVAETVDTAESEYPEYLNMDGAYPVIKDEYAGDIKLKVAIVQGATGGEWDDLWLSQYLSEKYNLEFEVESIQETVLEEKKTILLSSGEVPDIIWGFKLTTQDIYKYGQRDGVLLQLDEYINETLTPNIARYFEDPAIAGACTTPDGHIYSLPSLSDSSNEGGIHRLFINREWLDQLNIEMPKTLDEFTDALYKIKEADPAGVGSENLYPLSGSLYDGSMFYVMNAFGYIVNKRTQVTDPVLRDGKVVIPAYDMEVFQEYLKLMNQYYTDGIVDPNFVTIEYTEATGQVAGGQAATFREPVYTLGMDTFTEWEALYPLTSEWHDEPEWMEPAAVSIGNFAISAETEYPELCLRFADLYFNNTTDDCYALWVGAGETGENAEYNFGYASGGYDPETNGDYFDTEKFPEGVDLWTYLMGYIAGFVPNVGALNLPESYFHHYRCLGYDPAEEVEYDVTTGEGAYRSSIKTNVKPYMVDGFPTIYYLDDETTNEMNNLVTIIKPYAEEQIALFITGKRPLSETSDFAKELEDMGAGRLLEIYEQIYANYLDN